MPKKGMEESPETPNLENLRDRKNSLQLQMDSKVIIC
jgi:hypothetical protein